MKLSISFLLLSCVAVLMLSGCAQPKTYYWENYSQTLYEYKKNPSDKTLAEHKQELLKIIEVSREHNNRVPPGVCCEYAFLLMKEGKNQEAMKYLDMEEQAYPESKKLVSLLKNRMEAQKK